MNYYFTWHDIEDIGRKHGLMYRFIVIVLKFIKIVMNRRNQTCNI